MSEPWLVEKVHYYRTLDFFSTFSSLADEDLAAEIQRRAAGGYFGRLREDQPLVDFKLLSFDTSRVWMIEDFMLVGKRPEFEGRFYETVFQRLAAISQGLFQPAEVGVEHRGYCSGGNARLVVRFALGERSHEVCFCSDLDVLVLSFTEQLNSILGDSGHTFEYFMDRYGLCFVLFLQHQQKERLLRERGWRFERHPGSWRELGDRWQEEGDLERAAASYRRALAIEFDPSTVAELTICLEQQGRKADARRVATEGIAHLEASAEQVEMGAWWIDLLRSRLRQLS
jgi:hypothetical protein